MELLFHRPEHATVNQQMPATVALEAQSLSMNLENHIGNKVKASFHPNQYYNEKIYILSDYTVYHDKNGINLSLKLQDGNILTDYRIDEVLKIDCLEYFNRIEYKAYKVLTDVYKETYNFCLYF